MDYRGRPPRVSRRTLGGQIMRAILVAACVTAVMTSHTAGEQNSRRLAYKPKPGDFVIGARCSRVRHPAQQSQLRQNRSHTTPALRSVLALSALCSGSPRGALGTWSHFGFIVL